jgi:hypothetical protein
MTTITVRQNGPYLVDGKDWRPSTGTARRNKQEDAHLVVIRLRHSDCTCLASWKRSQNHVHESDSQAGRSEDRQRSVTLCTAFVAFEQHVDVLHAGN